MIAEKLTSYTYPPGRQLFITCREKVLSNGAISMPDCTHEEADTRLLVHVKHALTEGMNKIKILSSDTDVVIIALGAYHKLRSDHQFDDIVIEFGVKKNH